MVKKFVFLFLFPLLAFCAGRPVTNDVSVVATPDDKLYLACSGVNKVAIAEVKH
jgi:hypothetical protein